MSPKETLIALAGQPNCGKSTVFNALTGASQHVANYPGVTVDKMTGWYKHNGTRITVVDLPGTYSLTSYSPEERVSRDFILHEKPAVAVNVMDAANLKRCLYLTFQLLEMEIPVVLNLNMMDVVEKHGMTIDTDRLARRLGIPVVPTVMKSGQGKPELMAAIDAVAGGKAPARGAMVDYAEMAPFIDRIAKQLDGQGVPGRELPPALARHQTHGRRHRGSAVDPARGFGPGSGSRPCRGPAAGIRNRPP